MFTKSSLNKKRLLVILMMALGLIFLLHYPVSALEYDDQREHVLGDKNIKNVININAGAAVVLGITFKRFHIPINYERVVRPDMSIVIGNHPAIPLNSSSSGVAYGSSVRIRNYRSLKAPKGFWREWGIWGIYQHRKPQEESRSALQKIYENSMAGVLFDVGYKFMGRSRMIIEPFVGISLPVVVFSKERTKFFGTLFPWAGLSIGIAF